MEEYRKSFRESSILEIEENLKKDMDEYNKKRKRIIFIIIVLLLLIFHGSIIYWVKFGIATPTSYDYKEINIKDEPIQINYTPEEQQQKKFKYHSLINENSALIVPQAHYELSGTVVAYNHDFLFVSKTFDSAALYDIGVAWGIMGDKDFYKKYYKSYSAKNEVSGSRVLWTKQKSQDAPIDFSKASTLYSHSHIVPANRNVMAGFLKIRKWDKVKIEGDLIDMYYDENREYHTSMSRNDGGWSGDRGYGSCETIYATKLILNHKVYQ